VTFPRRLLNTGEEVVLDLRPHWSFFAGPATLLVVALAALVAVAVNDVGDWALLAAAGVVVAALVWFAGRYSRWATTNFVLTTDRLIYRAGVVAKKGVEMPLERVNTVFSSQSVLERLLRFGDLTIESAGERGQQTFSDIPEPGLVQNEIYKQIEDNHGRMFGGSRQPDVVDQIDRLDDLRRRGVISEAEFQAKKAKLLDQL
jgi:membrane protein YdbS with pleckstrin-like domain